jgi:hypothetical protein
MGCCGSRATSAAATDDNQAANGIPLSATLPAPGGAGEAVASFNLDQTRLQSEAAELIAGGVAARALLQGRRDSLTQLQGIESLGAAQTKGEQDAKDAPADGASSTSATPSRVNSGAVSVQGIYCDCFLARGDRLESKLVVARVERME